MRTTHKVIAIAVSAVAAVALGMGAAAAAGRAVGGSGFGPGGGFGGGVGMMGGGSGYGGGMMANRGSGVRTGPGFGMMRGSGANGAVGTGAGCPGLAAAAKGTLTTAEQSALVAMANEEKLAHDVYAALAVRYPTVTQFAHIVNAEQQHLTMVRTLLTRYGLTDPTTGFVAGKFADSAVQAQYDAFLAQAVDGASALKVGVAIEKADIADLAKLLDTVTAPDVQQVLTMLDRASDMHLAAFGG